MMHGQQNVKYQYQSQHNCVY